MIIDEIRSAKSAEPFRPFIVETNDGRSFLVDDYFHIGVAPNGLSVAVALSDGGFDFLHASSITAVKILTPAAS